MNSKNRYYLKNDCRLCNSKKMIYVLRLEDSPICDEYLRKRRSQNFYRLGLKICKDCDFVQLDCVVDPKTLYKDYIYFTKTSHGLDKHFKEYSKQILQIIKKKSGLIMDIGSNDGTLLKYFKKQNFDVIGVEPSIKASQLANKNKIKTYNCFFD